MVEERVTLGVALEVEESSLRAGSDEPRLPATPWRLGLPC